MPSRLADRWPGTILRRPRLPRPQVHLLWGPVWVAGLFAIVGHGREREASRTFAHWADCHGHSRDLAGYLDVESLRFLERSQARD